MGGIYELIKVFSIEETEWGGSFLIAGVYKQKILYEIWDLEAHIQ